LKKQWGFFTLDDLRDGSIVVEFDGVETAFLARKNLSQVHQNVQWAYIEELGAQK